MNESEKEKVINYLKDKDFTPLTEIIRLGGVDYYKFHSKILSEMISEGTVILEERGARKYLKLNMDKKGKK